MSTASLLDESKAAREATASLLNESKAAREAQMQHQKRCMSLLQEGLAAEQELRARSEQRAAELEGRMERARAVVAATGGDFGGGLQVLREMGVALREDVADVHAGLATLEAAEATRRITGGAQEAALKRLETEVVYKQEHIERQQGVMAALASELLCAPCRLLPWPPPPPPPPPPLYTAHADTATRPVLSNRQPCHPLHSRGGDIIKKLG
jgi:uncharacterized coiled-coil protein SlyX